MKAMQSLDGVVFHVVSVLCVRVSARAGAPEKPRASFASARDIALARPASLQFHAEPTENGGPG